MTMTTLSKQTPRKILTAGLIFAITLNTGCSLFSVYTIDIPQGTPITQTKAQNVQIGMTAGEVVYILGTPTLRDTLSPNRWDYIYDYQAGTIGTRDGKQDINNASQHLSIYFDNAGKVNKIVGLENLPK